MAEPKPDWRGLKLVFAGYLVGMVVVSSVVFLGAPAWVMYLVVPCWIVAVVGGWMHHRSFMRTLREHSRSMHPPAASYRPPPGGHATDRFNR